MNTQMIQMAQEELADARKRGHLFPPKMQAVINTLRSGVKDGKFSFEELGSSEEELVQLERKAGLVK